MQSIQYSGQIPESHVHKSANGSRNKCGNKKQLKRSAFVNRVLIAVILFCMWQQLFAATKLQDDISLFTLSKENNPYYIVDDIEVPENKKMVIPAGIVFLFNELTGFKVKGSLSVEGTEEDPVVFSSIKDSLYQANASGNPYSDDWTGVVISRQSESAVFSHCILKYSTSGITSQSPNVQIDSGIFAQNSKNLEVDGKVVIDIQDGKPFIYPPEKVVPPEPPEPLELPEPLPDKVDKDVLSLKNKIRISSAAIACVSLVAAIFLHKEQRDRLSKIEENKQDGIDPSAQRNLRVDRIAKEGFCLGLITGSLVGFSLTFVY